MLSNDYIAINRANWDERAPQHARAPSYSVELLVADPNRLSDVVNFDRPLLGDITGLRIVHLQCHIGTDTISLARRGAREVIGLDFSPASLIEARSLAQRAAGCEQVSFVEGNVYDAASILADRKDFDLVFTGVGAICWIPDIKRWARTVAALLKPGGRLFIREDHPMHATIDELITDRLVVRYPYFETLEAEVFDSDATYVPLGEVGKRLTATRTLQWNHGLGEIVQAVIDSGMMVTGLTEHRSVPWESLPGQMEEIGGGEWVLREGRDRLPLSFTLQAVRKE